MKNKWRFGRREKILLVVLILLLITVFLKSNYYDKYIPKTAKEKEIKNEVEKVFSSSILVRKDIVSIKDSNKDDMRYNVIVKLRYYLLGFIPIKDRYIRM